MVIVDSKGRLRYAWASEGPTEVPQRASNKKKVEQAASKGEEPTNTTEGFICNKCGVEITKKVNDYSEKKYGKALCFKCQKEV